jgi:hypothetical protein
MYRACDWGTFLHYFKYNEIRFGLVIVEKIRKCKCACIDHSRNAALHMHLIQHRGGNSDLKK